MRHEKGGKQVEKSSRFQLQTSFQRGVVAERKALWFLEEKGYTCVAERFRTRVGEIDLICQNQNTLLFVEVKQRKTIEEALYALSASQIQRLYEAALCFLKTVETSSWKEYRFDFIALSQGADIQHIQNISLFPIEL